MKTRNGFVSNSSSSSFIILKQDKTLSYEKLTELSLKEYKDHYGADFDDSEGYFTSKSEKWAKEGKYLFLLNSVDYGAEEAVECAIKGLLEKLNIDGITYEVGE